MGPVHGHCTMLFNAIFSKEGEMTETSLQKNTQKVKEMLFLSVAYASSCGGVGTLTGTGPNLVLKEMPMKMQVNTLRQD